LQHLDHLFAAGLRQVIRKKSAVPDDYSHRHFSFVGHGPFVTLFYLSDKKATFQCKALRPPEFPTHPGYRRLYFVFCKPPRITGHHSRVTFAMMPGNAVSAWPPKIQV
jgi:hypothetical protein